MEKIVQFIEKAFLKLYQISGLEHLSWRHFLVIGVSAAIALIIDFILVPDKKNSSLYKLFYANKSVRTDIIYWLIDGFGLFTVIGIILTLGIFYYISGIPYRNQIMHVKITEYIKNEYVQFIVVFVLVDLKNYFKHWLFHKYHTLWKIHEVHHSATEFVSINSHRGHFIEGCIDGIISSFLFALIGSSTITIVFLVYLVEIQQLLLHSNINTNWGFIGRYILVSPAAHRIHHSIDPKHFNKNLGGVFIFFDRIFGTYYPPQNETIQIGIPSNVFNQKGFFHDVFIAYKRSIMTLMGKEVD